ncbi:hypothetical protein PR048_013120 [Dryococelus australis]|uniref:Vitellogenin n=1 Tax=Dryococelus australis TaxID=614101 RepID=A0ABQ9HR96_9NEOP|nr:hypothetical protein PR048_013120 [Dryococelus australis]
MMRNKGWIEEIEENAQEIVVAKPIKLCPKVQSDDVSNVLNVPDLSANLLSASTMANRRLKVFFDSEDCKVYDDCQTRGNITITSVNEGGVYKMKYNSRNINTHEQSDALSVQDVKQ